MGYDPIDTVDFGRPAGPVKALHGVNNAPVRIRKPGGKVWEFEEAGIPFMRTHDTAGGFGGAHYVDIPNVVRDFDADESDPKNYDFAFAESIRRRSWTTASSRSSVSG